MEDMEKTKIHVARPMKMKNSEIESPVDIIIPFRGQYEKVTRCVESIFRFTSHHEYKITLVDDASKNSNFIKRLSDLEGIHIETNEKVQILNCLRNPQQLGFVGSLEVGFHYTDKNWVIFMNSDVEIQDVNWLDNLKKTMFNLKNHGVKMVAAKNTNPCGHDRMKCDDSTEDYILEDGYLSLECVLFHRDLFRYIGGFLKNYFPGWYEDEELAFRMKQYGYKQAICGKCCVFHHGQATISDLWKEKIKFKHIMKSNREKCIEDIKKLLSTTKKG